MIAGLWGIPASGNTAIAEAMLRYEGGAIVAIS